MSKPKPKFFAKHPKIAEALSKNPRVAKKVEEVLDEHPSIDTALDGAAEQLEQQGLEKIAKESGKEAGTGAVIALIFGSAVLPAAVGGVASYVAYEGAKGAYKALKNQKPKPPESK